MLCLLELVGEGAAIGGEAPFFKEGFGLTGSPHPQTDLAGFGPSFWIGFTVPVYLSRKLHGAHTIGPVPVARAPRALHQVSHIPHRSHQASIPVAPKAGLEESVEGLDAAGGIAVFTPEVQGSATTTATRPAVGVCHECCAGAHPSVEAELQGKAGKFPVELIQEPTRVRRVLIGEVDQAPVVSGCATALRHQAGHRGSAVGTRAGTAHLFHALGELTETACCPHTVRVRDVGSADLTVAACARISSVAVRAAIPRFAHHHVNRGAAGVRRRAHALRGGSDVDREAGVVAGARGARAGVEAPGRGVRREVGGVATAAHEEREDDEQGAHEQTGELGHDWLLRWVRSDPVSMTREKRVSLTRIYR